MSVGSHSQAEFAQCLLRLKQRMKGDLEGEKAKWVCCVGVQGCMCVLCAWVGMFIFCNRCEKLYSLNLYTFYTWKVCTCNEPGSP